jgi:dTDP-4-amino-4,6-dideoxygalactose transaminase
MPVAHEVSRQVLCLPIYPALTDEEVNRIADTVCFAASVQRQAAA